MSDPLSQEECDALPVGAKVEVRRTRTSEPLKTRIVAIEFGRPWIVDTLWPEGVHVPWDLRAPLCVLGGTEVRRIEE